MFPGGPSVRRGLWCPLEGGRRGAVSIIGQRRGWTAVSQSGAAGVMSLRRCGRLRRTRKSWCGGPGQGSEWCLQRHGAAAAAAAATAAAAEPGGGKQKGREGETVKYKTHGTNAPEQHRLDRVCSATRRRHAGNGPTEATESRHGQKRKKQGGGGNGATLFTGGDASPSRRRGRGLGGGTRACVEGLGASAQRETLARRSTCLFGNFSLFSRPQGPAREREGEWVSAAGVKIVVVVLKSFSWLACKTDSEQKGSIRINNQPTNQPQQQKWVPTST